jgi:endonuclease/exonuclease/phosphatase family metal-dependent hydrolase
MSLDILSWNVHAGFADEASRGTIMETLDDLHRTEGHYPGIAVYQEAYKQQQDERGQVPFDDIATDFDTRGYVVTPVRYEDADPDRPDRNALLLAVRTELVVPGKKTLVVRLAGESALGGRNALLRSFYDPDTGEERTFLGGHLEDTDEAHRQPQVDTLLQWHPDILGLDANADPDQPMNEWLLLARGIGTLVRVGLFPNKPPTGQPMSPYRPGRIGNRLFRLDQMTRGTTIQRLRQEGGYVDTDPAHTPTHPAGNPLAQLDRVLVDPQTYTPLSTQVGTREPGFDHRAVLARVQAVRSR